MSSRAYKSSGTLAWAALFLLVLSRSAIGPHDRFTWWLEVIPALLALLNGENADDFPGTQCYAWDSQSDMTWALVGASSALLLPSPWHDRQLARL